MPAPSLVRLLYRSDAADNLNWSDVRAIVTKSIERNRESAISGMLIMSAGRFLQVIEGPAGAINRCYIERIMTDDRHRQITLIDYSQTTERDFCSWHMHAINIDGLPPEDSVILEEKYGREGRGLAFPLDPFRARSLLNDVHVLCRSAVIEARRQPSADTVHIVAGAP